MKKVLSAALFLLTLTVFAAAQNNLRQIDFNNFTYQSFCAGEEIKEITVKNSEFVRETEMEGYTARLYFKVFAVSHGDLNGDGREEAFVLALCNTGSSGFISEGHVFTLKNGKPALLTRIEGGDRAHGGLRSAKMEKGVLVVEKYAVSETGNACCPEFFFAVSYKWNGAELNEIGVSAPRDLYPPTPVAFENGKKTANVKLNIPATRFKRYSVKAGGGQMLKITTSSKTIVVNLIRGEADVNETDGAFVAVMYENGEYVIQFENNGGADEETLVKFEIIENL